MLTREHAHAKQAGSVAEREFDHTVSPPLPHSAHQPTPTYLRAALPVTPKHNTHVPSGGRQAALFRRRVTVLRRTRTI